MKRLFVFVVVLAMLSSLAACASTTKTDNTGETAATTGSDSTISKTADTASGEIFKLGTFQPLTGSAATQGTAALQSIQLYVEELNARGGILGRQVELYYYDDQQDAEEAVKCATKLIEVDKVDFVIASIISNCVLATGDIINNAKIPFAAMGFSSTLTQQGWEYCFRPTINNANTIPHLIDVMKNFGFQSVAIFEGQDDYGASSGQAMRDAAEAGGITVTTTENYVSGDTDFSGQVAKILFSNPDCVFLGVLGSEVGNAMKQFREFGYDGILFYSEPLQQDHYDIAGDATNHICFTFPYVTYTNIDDCKDEFMYAFLEKYYDAWGELPLGEAAYRCWDAMTVMETAIANAGTTDGTSVMEAVWNISDLEGLGGTLDFAKEKNGECLYETATYVVVNQVSVRYEDWIQTDDYKEFASEQGWS